MSATSDLTPEKALIFRITHRDNVPWILKHGLHCSESPEQDPGFVTIGSDEIISRRSRRTVPDPPGGVLADYVPFYFTPLSPMLYNIKTGYHGATQRDMDEIVILVSSLPTLVNRGLAFFFTDRHAIYNTVNFFSDLADIHHLPWKQLRACDFKKNPEDPDKFERYQAEALVHQHVPIDALIGVVCYNESVKTMIDTELARQAHDLEIKVYPRWFFDDVLHQR
jgi:hypothetical protein